MPKRVPAIANDYLMRQVGTLDDNVLLLPVQVYLLTGLSQGKLKERARTRPPQPPHPMPREKARQALWYSLGEVRRYLSGVAEAAESETTWRTSKHSGFVDWLTNASADEEWPIALIGKSKRPTDFWETIRGNIKIGRADRVRWMSLRDFTAAGLTTWGHTNAHHENVPSLHTTLTEFLAKAAPDETWPFVFEGQQQRPIDALDLPNTEHRVEPLTAAAYFSAMKDVMGWEDGQAHAIQREAQLSNAPTEEQHGAAFRRSTSNRSDHRP